MTSDITLAPKTHCLLIQYIPNSIRMQKRKNENAALALNLHNHKLSQDTGFCITIAPAVFSQVT